MGKTINDLHDILFEQLKRLNNPKLKDESLAEEIKRSKAVTDVARNIIDNADLALRVAVAQDDKISWKSAHNLPKMLTAGEDDGIQKTTK